MNKIIAIAGIIGAFVFGILTANPVVEAVGGWQPEVDNLQSQIDEITAEPPIIIRTATEVFEQNDVKTFEVTCNPNEIFLDHSVVVTYDPIPNRIPAVNTGSGQVSCDACTGDTGILSHVIGWNVQTFDSPNGFEVPTDVTISIACLNPDFLNPDILN